MIEYPEIKSNIISVLNKLYEDDACLFQRNSGRGLAERCINFRLAHYLQNLFPQYWVDCEFNSSFHGINQRSGKPIQNSNGTVTKRFIDIIIHKRDFNSGSGLLNDLVCFEIKKWNNKTTKGLKKDRNNLRVLTSQYGYKYGFHIILGKNINETTIGVFKRHGTERLLSWEAFHNG